MWVTVLGLPDALYWECSPREIDLCFIEHYRAQDAENSRFGTVAAAVYNSTPADAKQAKKRKWLVWTDFFNPLTSRRKPVKETDVVARAQADWQAAMDAKAELAHRK